MRTLFAALLSAVLLVGCAPDEGPGFEGSAPADAPAETDAADNPFDY